VTHFEKCKIRKKERRSERQKEKAAVTQKKILCRIAANELDAMSKSVEESRAKDPGSECGGRKRKPDALTPESRLQRRRMATNGMVEADGPVMLDFGLVNNAAGTTGLQNFLHNIDAILIGLKISVTLSANLRLRTETTIICLRETANFLAVWRRTTTSY
jgi:hypothetical protein